MTEDDQFNEVFDLMESEAQKLDELAIKENKLGNEFVEAVRKARMGVLTKEEAWRALRILNDYRKAREEYEKLKQEFFQKLSAALDAVERYMEQYFKKMV